MAASLPYQLSVNEAAFEKQLLGNIQHFKIYEDRSNQLQALAHVPLEDLRAIAQAKYDSSEKPTPVPSFRSEHAVRDMLLFEIMDWFKNEFFTWMNSPACPNCQNPTQGIGHGVPTMLEMTKSAGRVEIYSCTSCFSDNREVARFPRYNNPLILLETRTGRCGEWANCFALICRAAGFEVRHVHDHTDHVWIEVYSSSLSPNRWVHVDPCENSFDNPLLYEVGWGKKLSYIIAVSQDDIQDVTPRYSRDINKVLLRRTQVQESWLAKTIIRLRKGIQSGLPSSRKLELKNRWAQEIAEFFTPSEKRQSKDAEQIGRESGSLAWRMARQEMGNLETSCTVSDGYVWEIAESTVVDGKFELSYDSEMDTYGKKSAKGDISMKGWLNGVFSYYELCRKEERDWKMVYLAPRENSKFKTSSLSWKFKVGPEFTVDGLKINIKYSIFQSDAKFKICLVTDPETLTLLDTNVGDEVFTWNSKNGTDNEFLTKLKTSKTFTIICELTHGSGNEGWQKVQLFRQKMMDSTKSLTMLNRNLFNIEFYLQKTIM